MAGEVLRVSVEELALVFAQIGHADQAGGLLVAQSESPVTREEADARLRAAGHSLMARGWLTIDDQARVIIADHLVRLARAVSEADYSLRCEFATPHAEFQIGFHFSGGQIVRQTLSAGVIHSLSQVEMDELLDEVAVFYRVKDAERFSSPPATIPAAVLEETRQLPDAASVARRLEQAGVAPPTARIFADDLRAPQFRGTLLCVEYGANHAPQSNRGALLLRGPARLWLIPTGASNDDPTVRLLPGDEAALRDIVTQLVQPPAPAGADR